MDPWPGPLVERCHDLHVRCRRQAGDAAGPNETLFFEKGGNLTLCFQPGKFWKDFIIQLVVVFFFWGGEGVIARLRKIFPSSSSTSAGPSVAGATAVATGGSSSASSSSSTSTSAS